MAAIVVPFRGPTAKQRLEALPHEERYELALAMLGDVLAAATVAGHTTVATSDERARSLAAELGAATADDPGGGQAAAVSAALERVGAGEVLIVNADVPCVVPQDLRALAAARPPRGIALVAAADGTTNALALAEPSLFAPLYGPDSATRFREHAAAVGVEFVAASIANLADDVDTLADLERLGSRPGPRTLTAATHPCAGAWAS